MLIRSQPENERRLADQALLRALLHRSNYSSTDLHAQPGSNYETEVLIINRLRNGMLMADMQTAIWEDAVFSDAAALLRWEDEGGSPCGRDLSGTAGKPST